MSPPWISSLSEISNTTSVTHLGSLAITPEDANSIYNDVIKPSGLTLPILIQYLQEEPVAEIRAYVIVEVLLIRQSYSAETLEQLVALLKSQLQIPEADWNWNILEKTSFHKRYYFPLRALRAVLLSQELDQISELIEICANHINPYVPWSSETNHRIVTTIVDDTTINKRIQDEMFDFMAKLGDYLIKIPASISKSKPKTSIFGKNITTSKLHGGLRPRLGYGGSKKEILEEDIRRNWKASSKVRSLSMIWLVIQMIKPSEWFSSYWSVISSFILNVGDDHEPVMKIQSFKILEFFLRKLDTLGEERHLLLKSGLLDLYIEQGKVALTHTPPITAIGVSKQVLEEGYSNLGRLLGIKSAETDTKIEFIDIITVNILPSISQMVSPAEREEYIPILNLLVSNLNLIVSKHLHHGIAISLSRVLFTLNQLITNPYLIENKTAGFKFIEKVLQCQLTISEEILSTSDKQAAIILWDYRYDFLGTWIVLITRLHKMEAEKTAKPIILQLQQNFEMLKRVSDATEYDLGSDLRELYLKTPELKTILSTNGIDF